jgi:hypothetical protein
MMWLLVALAIWMLPAACLLLLYLCTFLSHPLRTWLLKHLVA